jgi:two-component system nitrate/nitrite response regulator NarL
MTRTRVLIADDHVSVRIALRRLLSEDFDIAGEASNGQEAVDASEELRPDVVLMDVSMPVMSGLEATRILHERMPQLRIVFVSQFADAAYADEVFRLGGSGYVLKRAAATELPDAIRAVMSGGTFLSSAVSTSA